MSSLWPARAIAPAALAAFEKVGNPAEAEALAEAEARAEAEASAERTWALARNAGTA
ncbi:hypothetical protein WMF37_18120 [Sorangium sp. So ce291]|uniref:hypothetical protein n=1 Tax=Sorangium sp. So ce291 TaxID=3133294 RepID=UPI003F634C2B